MNDDLTETNEPLWMPVLAPALWAVHFTLSYITAAVLCGRFGPPASPGLRIAVAGYTAVALAAMTLLFLHGLRRHRYQLPVCPHDDDSPEDRHHFVAFTTMLLAGLSVLATVFVAASVFLAGECA